MKNVRKMLALVLAVAMIATLAPMLVIADGDYQSIVPINESTEPLTPGAFPDVPLGHPHFEAIMVLAAPALGVLRGFPDGTFQPNGNVTRAEFTAMLMRTMGLDGIGSTTGPLPFDDIDTPGTSWAIANIVTASDMGIVQGVGYREFAPNDPVLFEQAVAMIVRAVNHGVRAQDLGDTWFAGYLMVGHEEGITPGSGGTIGQPATRGTNARMLFQSLEVRHLELRGEDNWVLSERTFLTDHLRLRRNTGIVYANNLTGLDRPDVVLREDEIRIRAVNPVTNLREVHTYRTDDIELRNLLGYSINFYYRYQIGGLRELVLATINQSNTITVDASQIDRNASIASGGVRYFRNRDDRNTINLPISTDNIVIYNGRLAFSGGSLTRFTPEMIPHLGRIRAIDNNNSGSFNVLFIESFEVYVVGSTIASSHTIIDNTNTPSFYNGNIVVQTRNIPGLDVNRPDQDVRIINAAGNPVPFSSIQQWNVVHMMESTRTPGFTPLRTAVVLNEVVTGVVNTTSRYGVRVGSRDLDFSPILADAWRLNVAGTLPQPDIGESARFFLDIEGNIISFEPQVSGGAWLFGYVMQAGEYGAMLAGNAARIHVLDQNNQRRQLNLANSVRIDGQTVNGAVAQLERLEMAAAAQGTPESLNYQQVIRFQTGVRSGETVVTDIVTVLDPRNDATNGVVRLANTTTRTFNFTSSNTTLAAVGTPPQTVNVRGATVFVVPTNRNDTTGFHVAPNTTQSPAFRNNQSGIVMEAFNVVAGTARVIVNHGGSDNMVGPTTGVTMFHEAVQTMVNDEAVTIFRGRYFPSGRTGAAINIEETVAANSVSAVNGLQRGDLIRFGMNSDNRMFDIQRVSIARNPNATSVPLYQMQGATAANADQAPFRIIRGSVFDRNPIVGGTTSDFRIVDEVLTTSEDETLEIYDFDNIMQITRDMFNSQTSFFRFQRTAVTNEMTVHNATLTEVIDEMNSYYALRGTSTAPTQLILYISENVVRLAILVQD